MEDTLCLQAKDKESGRPKKWECFCAGSKVWEEI